MSINRGCSSTGAAAVGGGLKGSDEWMDGWMDGWVMGGVVQSAHHKHIACLLTRSKVLKFGWRETTKRGNDYGGKHPSIYGETTMRGTGKAGKRLKTAPGIYSAEAGLFTAPPVHRQSKTLFFSRFIAEGLVGSPSFGRQ